MFFMKSIFKQVLDLYIKIFLYFRFCVFEFSFLNVTSGLFAFFFLIYVENFRKLSYIVILKR